MNGNGWNPGKLLQVSGNYWQGFALHVSVKLGLYDILGDHEMGANELAAALECDERGLSLLLNAVTAMGLLTKSKDKFSNTEVSKAYLVKDSRHSIHSIIMHHHNLVTPWSKLDQAVKTGKPVRRRGDRNEQELESFLMGMFNMGMAIAPRLSKEIELSSRRRLLDLGGGPGTYAIHFCLENADLKGTVFDLPTTRPYAEKTIASFGLSERIQFLPGSYLEDDIGGTYDVVWMSHIFHGEGPRGCQKIIEKALSVLEPGGLMLIHEFILHDSFDGPLFPALFSLNMLVNTEEGRAYAEGEYRAMLKRAGLKNIRRLPFEGPTQSGIIAAES